MMRISRVGNCTVRSETRHSHCATRGPRGQGGLTLLELMAALVILGLLLTVVPPALNSLSPRWRLRSAAQQVAATVQWARNAAAVQDKPVQILYDVPEGAYWVRVGEQTHALRSLPGDVRFNWVKFGSIVVTSDVAACEAFPDGTLDPHQVMLRNQNDRRMSLHFDRLTGEPAYEEETHDAN